MRWGITYFCTFVLHTTVKKKAASAMRDRQLVIFTMTDQEIIVHDKTFVPYIKGEQLRAATRRLAEQIRHDTEGRDPLFVCIMNGSFMFAAELLQAINTSAEVAFARYSSYSGMGSTYQLKEVMPVTTPLAGRLVIIIEDLIDTGFTMMKLKEKFLADGAAEVRIVTMLLKPEALQCPIHADYVGMEIHNSFIVGHGLDYNELGRMLDDIYILKE